MSDNKTVFSAEEFNTNSYSGKKEVEKVVTGEVTTRKKPLSKKFAETFLVDDVENVKSYIIFDFIIPGIKEMVANAINGAIDALFWEGSGRAANSRRSSGTGTYVSYSNYYTNKRDTRPAPKSSRHDFRDIVFESRGEAEEVLSNLVDLIYEYGTTSVADLYDLVGITGSFTDNKYGWTNLSQAKVVRARGGGYIIDLPRTQVLD